MTTTMKLYRAIDKMDGADTLFMTDGTMQWKAYFDPTLPWLLDDFVFNPDAWAADPVPFSLGTMDMVEVMKEHVPCAQ